MYRPKSPSQQINKNLNKYHLTSREDYHHAAFSRNIGIFSETEQMRLANCKVAIPGMGGVGGNHLITLTRIGIGRFHLADFDVFEPANLNRQAGARLSSLGRPKLEVMKDDALDINPFLDLKLFPKGLLEDLIDEFLEGVDLVVDSLDFFCFEIRRKLFNRAKEKGIYVITAGPLGLSTAMLVFSPDGMGFDDYFSVSDIQSEEEAALHFALGLAPRTTHTKYIDFSKVDLAEKRGPSTDIACKMAAALAATEAVRILLKKGNVEAVPHYVQLDPFTRQYVRGKLRWGNRGLLQKLKMKYVRSLLKNPRHTPLNRKLNPPEETWVSGEIPDSYLDFIIEAGIQAPSGDNVQPWLFEKGPNELRLFLDSEADGSFFNFGQIASVISAGSVIENMLLAAQAVGAGVEISLLPEESDLNFLARLRFDPQNPKSHPLFPYIAQRHTNRRMFSRQKISVKVLEELKELAEADGVSKLRFFSKDTQKGKIANLIYHADKIRTERRDLHEHLAKMIRFDLEEVRNTKDGFYLKNLEAGLLGEQFIKATRSWGVMNFMNKVKLGRVVPFHSSLGIKKSAAVGLLTVLGRDRGDFLAGGRSLQRLWLKLTQLGIAMQPMTAVTLFFLRWQMGGKSDFSLRHQNLLQKVIPAYEKLFQDPAAAWKEAPVMLFRIGYAKEIHHFTSRKDPEHFLRK